ncbi:MAG: peptide deformylase [Limisphaerales bacterium]
MILPIVRYGHPALRRKGVAVEAVNAEIRQLIADMFETMYDAHGIGLAAQQVGKALQLAVVDIRGITDRPSTLTRDGQPVDPETAMPLVLINPQIQAVGDPVTGPEGCLSFPEIYADITRPESIEVRASGADGRPYQFQCGGLLAKAIQHEVDHLNGILFKDRMSKTALETLKDELDDLMAETKRGLK